MGDLWQDEGFGGAGAVGDASGDDDWDDGEESLETTLEDGFDDPDELEEDGWDDGEDEVAVEEGVGDTGGNAVIGSGTARAGAR